MLSADAPVWVARDLRAGVRAAAEAGADVAVIDDGDRTLSLTKDLWLLAADAERNVRNAQIGLGSRQELPNGLAEADALVLIGEGPGEPVQSAAQAAGMLILHADILALNASELAGRRVIAFAGIAQPERAFATLREAGAEVAAEIPFPDHHPYTQQDWSRLLALAEDAHAELVTTEKDAVRLPPDWRRRAWVMRVELRFQEETELDSLLARAEV